MKSDKYESPVYFKEWRKFAGFSQEQLADRMGTSAPTVSRIEKGDRDFSGHYLQTFANAIGCHPGDPISRLPPTRVPTLTDEQYAELLELRKLVAAISEQMKGVQKT